MSSTALDDWPNIWIKRWLTCCFDTAATLLQAHAASAKAGVDTLMRHVALEYGPYGIRANTLARTSVTLSQPFHVGSLTCSAFHVSLYANR